MLPHALKSYQALTRLLTVLASLAAASPAMAATLNLTCQSAAAPAEHFTVDLAANTVGNMPARINTTAIDWDITDNLGDGEHAVRHFHIDRVNGTLTASFTVYARNGSVIRQSTPTTSPCAATAAPTTVF